jgi:peptide chain release factor 2
LTSLRTLFDIAKKEEHLQQIEKKSGAPDFWDDAARAGKVLQGAAQIKEELSFYERIKSAAEEAEVLLELVIESEDAELETELETTVRKLASSVQQWERETLFSGRYDRKNALISLHAGAGGTEAQDWVEMLSRMYGRWAQDRGFNMEVLDMLPGDEAGIKSLTALIAGASAYGYLKSERGIHRLVRISPFDASGRRHTSFASVDVIPEVDDDGEVAINPDDLRVDTYRASGPGGQYVNKTDSAVRITHLPTGIVVQCQTERSQLSNRLRAMKMLSSHLSARKHQEQEDEMARLRGVQREIAWGSQIRSYVFEPYTLVKDHRTGVEVGNVQSVMDGALNPFMEAYLRQFRDS